MDFVEICNVYIGKMIIKAAKRIFNSDKICRSYSDLNFGVTFLEHSVVYYYSLITSQLSISDVVVYFNRNHARIFSDLSKLLHLPAVSMPHAKI